MPSKPGKQNEKVHFWGVFIIVKKTQCDWQLPLLFQLLQTIKYLQMNLLHSIDLIIIYFTFLSLNALKYGTEWDKITNFLCVKVL